MAEPTQIENHSDDALARLIDFFQGKPNVETLLRNKSAARVDVLSALKNEEYALTINNCLVAYTAEHGDTAPDIAGALVQLIESGGGVLDRDTFDEYVLGILRDQVGPFGKWRQAVPPQFGLTEAAPDWRVEESDIISAPNAVRSPWDLPLAPGGGVQYTALNYLLQYPGYTETAQTLETWFWFEDGFPGANPAGCVFYPMLDTFAGSGLGLILGVAYDPGVGKAYVRIGSTAAPFPIHEEEFDPALILTGPHKVTVEFDTTTGVVTFKIDDGDVFDHTFPALGALSIFIYGMGAAAINNLATAWPGFKSAFRDNLQIGTPAGCEIADMSTFEESADESFEGYTAGLTFNGPGVWATWSDSLPAPPTLGGYIIDNAIARTGAKSIKTNMAAGIGPDVAAPNIFHVGATTSFPGQTLDYQAAHVWFKTGGASFPGITFEATGANLSPYQLVFADFVQNTIVAGSIGVRGSDYSKYYVGARLFGGAEDYTEIPRAALDDGNFHKLSIWFNRSGGPVAVSVDANWTAGVNLAVPMDITLAGVLGGFDGLAAPVAVAGEWNADDMVFGGTAELYAPVKAQQLDGEDEFFYLYPRRTPGLEVNASPEDVTKLAVSRIGIVDQIQELENTLFSVLGDRWLSTAAGEQLAKLGELLGRGRTGTLTDDEYRQLLGVQITRNLSNGEADRLIQVAAALTDSTWVKLVEYFPGFVDLSMDKLPPDPSTFNALMDAIAAGGVRVSSAIVPDVPFGFDGDPDALGFDEGEFAGTI